MLSDSAFLLQAGFPKGNIGGRGEDYSAADPSPDLRYFVEDHEPDGAGPDQPDEIIGKDRRCIRYFQGFGEGNMSQTAEYAHDSK